MSPSLVFDSVGNVVGFGYSVPIAAIVFCVSCALGLFKLLWDAKPNPGIWSTLRYAALALLAIPAAAGFAFLAVPASMAVQEKIVEINAPPRPKIIEASAPKPAAIKAVHTAEPSPPVPPRQEAAAEPRPASIAMAPPAPPAPVSATEAAPPAKPAPRPQVVARPDPKPQPAPAAQVATASAHPGVMVYGATIEAQQRPAKGSIAAASPAGGTQGAGAPNPEQVLAMGIKAELKRLGCYAGAADSSWGKDAKSAVNRFNAYGHRSISDVPENDSLAILKAFSAQVCP